MGKGWEKLLQPHGADHCFEAHGALASKHFQGAKAAQPRETGLRKGGRMDMGRLGVLLSGSNGLEAT